MNKCKKPNYNCKMYRCTVEDGKYSECDYYEKASRTEKCIYIMILDDFVHCGCCKAQIAAG